MTEKQSSSVHLREPLLGEVGGNVIANTSLIGGIVNWGTAVEEEQELKGGMERIQPWEGMLWVVTLSSGKDLISIVGKRKIIAILVGSRSSRALYWVS